MQLFFECRLLQHSMDFSSKVTPCLEDVNIEYDKRLFLFIREEEIKDPVFSGTIKKIPDKPKIFSMIAIALLIVSNVFMTFAWYGHLRYRESALWKVILISWGIAFLEYCFQVPANRIGSYQFSTVQLKTIQEAITLVVFCIFSVLYLKEGLRWNHFVGFCFLVGAVFFIFKK